MIWVIASLIAIVWVYIAVVLIGSIVKVKREEEDDK